MMFYVCIVSTQLFNCKYFSRLRCCVVVLLRDSLREKKAVCVIIKSCSLKQNPVSAFCALCNVMCVRVCLSVSVRA